MISQSIRQHITRLGKTEPFTTKDFLAFGPRSTVDQTLARLVKNGYIVRLAPGVFAREAEKEFSTLEITTVKVKSKIKKALAKFELQSNLIEETPSVDLDACVKEFHKLSSNLQNLISNAS